MSKKETDMPAKTKQLPLCAYNRLLAVVLFPLSIQPNLINATVVAGTYLKSLTPYL